MLESLGNNVAVAISQILNMQNKKNLQIHFYGIIVSTGCLKFPKILVQASNIEAEVKKVCCLLRKIVASFYITLSLILKSGRGGTFFPRVDKVAAASPQCITNCRNLDKFTATSNPITRASLLSEQRYGNKTRNKKPQIQNNS